MRRGWGSSQTYKNKTGPWLPWKQQQAIFEFQTPSLFKRGREQNLSCEICVRITNHFQIDSMVLHLASLWNWGLGQLENGLLVSYAVVIWVVTQRPPQREKVTCEPDGCITSSARQRSAKYWGCSRAPLATCAWRRCHSWLSKGNLACVAGAWR